MEGIAFQGGPHERDIRVVWHRIAQEKRYVNEHREREYADERGPTPLVGEGRPRKPHRKSKCEAAEGDQPDPRKPDSHGECELLGVLLPPGREAFLPDRQEAYSDEDKNEWCEQRGHERVRL